jgi:hypothetical protein
MARQTKGSDRDLFEGKDPKPRAEKPWSGAPRGYVNADLSKSEKGDYDAWQTGVGNSGLFDMLLALVDDGYRVAFSQDDKGFRATCTNVEGPLEARGLCLSGYGSDAFRAATSLLYKHYVKLAADWGAGDSEDDTYVR